MFTAKVYWLDPYCFLVYVLGTVKDKILMGVSENVRRCM